MTIGAITESNKATTLRDETAALQAEAQRHAVKAQPVQAFNDFADEVKKRTLLIGGLAESRFPWDTALKNLAESTPPDVTLDNIQAATGDGTAPAAGQAAPSASLQLTGCSGSWIGLSRFIVRLREMPGVATVTSSNGSVGTSAGADASGVDRKANCGPAPLTFQIRVAYAQRKVDLVGLPKVGAAGAGATGATGAAPAASATPAPTSTTPPAQ
jgi:hypothetical protein